MKLLKNEFVIFIILVVLIIGIGGGMYFYQQKEPNQEIDYNNVTDTSGQMQNSNEQPNEQANNQQEQTSISVEEELNKERTLDDQLYSITIPKGWVQADTDSNNFLSLVIKPKNPINSANMSSIDYDTYYAVNNTKLETNSLDEYVDLLKQSLTEQIPSIQFTRQSYGTINNFNSIYLESESQTDGKNYKTLLVFVEDNEWVWAISFNTLTDSWQENKDIFYKVANSLIIK